MRGRLLFAFQAEIFRADPATTRNVDPGGGGQASGFDDDFKELVLADRNGDGISDFKRAEMAPVLVPCQVEPVSNDSLRMTDGGNSPDSAMDLVFHFRDLERLALVDAATGAPLIRVGDRLSSLRDRNGNLVEEMRTPLFVVEARPIGFGLGLHLSRRNLLYVKFRDRSPRGL